MTPQETPVLSVLGDRGLTVGDPSQDVRGRHVKDKDGQPLGTVTDLIVDAQRTTVRFLVVEHGGRHGVDKTLTMIPVDAVSQVAEDEVVVDRSSGRVASAPAYAPDLVEHRPYHAKIYDHYGYTPYWVLDREHQSFADPRPPEEPTTPTTYGTASLYALGDRGQTVEGSTPDVRGRAVKDKDGHRVGKVVDLMVDEQEKKVRFLVVEHGGLLGIGGTHVLIPVDAVSEVDEHEVVIDASHERVAAAPALSPELVDDRDYHGSLYDHYGHAPYWGPGYVDPYFMAEAPFGVR